MTEESRLPGQTTVAPEVLIDIVRLSALSVEGVSHLSDAAGEINRLFSKSVGEGVYIVLEDDVVNTTIYLVQYSEFQSNIEILILFPGKVRTGYLVFYCSSQSIV